MLSQILYKRLLAKHPCPNPICLPTDKYSLPDKLSGIRKVIDIQKNKLDTIYRPALHNLRELYHRYDRCFIIGNGPSLNNTDLGFLANEVTFGVNGIFLNQGFLPTFYVVEDHLVAEDRAEQINAISGIIKLFPVYLSYCLNEGPDTLFFNHLPRKSYPHGFDFSLDAKENTYTGGTVTFTCMQLAFYLGFKRIYLIGLDHNYSIPDDADIKNSYNIEIIDMQTDDPNHFCSDYFGKGYRWHSPHVEKMESAYLEAERVSRLHDVRIFNATIGGQLEVFERVEYKSLFHGAATNYDGRAPVTLTNIPVCIQQPKHGTSDRNKHEPPYAASTQLQKPPQNTRPRVLVVSYTAMNDQSATGALVKTLFRNWSTDTLAQIHSDLEVPHSSLNANHFFLQRKGSNFGAALKFIDRFSPDIIYFRATDKPEIMWRLITHFVDLGTIPIVTHIMDDWPERIKVQSPKAYLELNRHLCRVLYASKTALVISEQMAVAFRDRYQMPFGVIANFIELEQWPISSQETSATNKTLTIRYAGSLAKDMQLDSLLDFASAVHSLQDTIPVRFEIYCHERYRKPARKFRNFSGVSVNPYVPDSQYSSLLRDADILLFAANFDANSISYIRYSIANKLPEYMASGTTILAYGPPQTATIDYIRKGEFAKTVAARNPELLTEAIVELYNNPRLRSEYALLARDLVERNHSAKVIENKFLSILQNAARSQSQKGSQQ